VAEAPAVRSAPESEVSEHVEAVVSGRLRQALLLTLLILVVELGGGVLSHSLALLADAGHVTTDIFCARFGLVRGQADRAPS
jgi:Co/Zn/Cd efflux system component